jgi:hypothetical protein
VDGGPGQGRGDGGAHTAPYNESRRRARTGKLPEERRRLATWQDNACATFPASLLVPSFLLRWRSRGRGGAGGRAQACEYA